MKPVVLGAWTLETGNSCDLVYRGDGKVTIAWDRYPLTAAEQLDYLLHVQRPVIARVLEYREERPRRVLVATLV